MRFFDRARRRRPTPASQTSCALLIPVVTNDTAALDVLERVLAEAAEAGFDELIAIEQVRGRRSRRLRRLLRRTPRARHLVVQSDEPLAERARLLNCGLAICTSDRVWAHDQEVLLPFASLLPGVRAAESATLHPFGWMTVLDRDETHKLLASGEPPPLEGRKRMGETIGKGSYVVRADVLRALGGWNERLIGEADEGRELTRRTRPWFKHRYQLDEPVALRLHRSRGRADRDSRAPARALTKRLLERLEGDPEGYLATEVESPFEPRIDELERIAKRVERELSLSVSDPMPPPEQPASLPGSIWGITTFFNPAGWTLKRENYRAFREGIEHQGLPLLTVELAFGQRDFELGPDDAEILVQIRAQDVMWHKERLLNIGRERLPDDCDKVVWLDCDVLFENEAWVKETATQLERFVVVQPFRLSARLELGETRIDLDDLPIGGGEHEMLHGMAWGVAAKGRACLEHYFQHGHTGYGWAARRNLLDRHHFYDRDILGNNDRHMARAMYEGASFLHGTRLSQKGKESLARWAEPFQRDVQGSVGWTEGVVYHLWHGAKKDRIHDVRLQVLIDNDFDPEHDLALGEGGVYAWASDKPALHAWCERYFRLRREDPPASNGSGDVG